MAEQGEQGTERGHRAALEATRRADARQLPHEQPEIEAADLHEHALQDVGMPAQMHAAHPSGLIEMRVGTFQPLAPLPQQPLPTGAPNPPTISIHGLPRRGLSLPVAPTAVRFRDVTANTDGGKRDHRGVAVIPLIRDHLGDAGPSRQDGFNLVGGGDERLDHRRRVADETWGGVPYEKRLHVGSWMPPSYDPELNLIYVGTSVTSPAPKFLLGGADNQHLYHNCTLALDADTGEIVWYYQHLNDHWDLDHPFERLLVDTAVAPDPSSVEWINPRLQPGERRKVITGIPGKTGVVYTLDRETGEFLWATPTVGQNIISHIDGATGDVTENSEVVFSAYGQEVLSCPGWLGGKDWEAGAYSPLTNTMYYPLRNSCGRVLATPDEGLRIYQLAVKFQLAPGTDQLGTVHAISAETGETRWLHEQRAATLSLAATGGGLIFGGDVNGRFKAFDQETGAVLWEINLGSPATGFPITFSVDGRQYVAASTGSAATAGGFRGLTPELRPSNGNNLFVFALPD